MRPIAVLVAAFAAATAAHAQSATPFYTAVVTKSWHGIVGSDGQRRALPGFLSGYSLSPDEPSFVAVASPTKLFLGSLAYGGRTVTTPLRTSPPVYGPDGVVAYGAGAQLRVVGGRTYRLPGRVVEVAATTGAFAVTVQTGDRSRLWLVAGGRTKLLASNFSVRPQAEFSPDGALIAYRRAGDIWVSDRAGMKQQITHTKIAAERDARWSPDGTQLAYTTGRHGPNEVYVATLDGQELRLTHSQGPLGSTMGAWSPDGDEVAVVTNNSVGVVPVAGGTERIVKTFTPAKSAYVGPIWWSGSY